MQGYKETFSGNPIQGDIYHHIADPPLTLFILWLVQYIQRNYDNTLAPPSHTLTYTITGVRSARESRAGRTH
jgi:hypothetical protein